MNDDDWAYAAREKQLELVVEQLEHRNTRHSLYVYRVLALLGWLLALVVLSVPSAKAETLPQGAIACDTEADYLKQQETLTDLTLMSDPGCVFTDRALTVRVVGDNQVYVESVGIHVWVDAEVLK